MTDQKLKELLNSLQSPRYYLSNAGPAGADPVRSESLYARFPERHDEASLRLRFRLSDSDRGRLLRGGIGLRYLYRRFDLVPSVQELSDGRYADLGFLGDPITPLTRASGTTIWPFVWIESGGRDFAKAGYLFQYGPTEDVPLGWSAELAIGGSILNSVYAFTEDSLAPEQLRSWLFGGDIKYKYKPSRYTSLQIESEGIIRVNNLEEGEGNITSYGAYGYIDYRFSQKYNAGGIFEYVKLEEAEHHEGETEHEIHEHSNWRVGLFAGFSPVEETSLLRLVGHWTESEESDGFWEISLQFVFSLGPHQPHNF